jgi:predicted porin
MSLSKCLLPVLAISAGVCTTAHAQSSYNLYGVVDLSIASMQLSGTQGSADNKHLTKVDGNNMITSYIGLKGVEDLGDGLKAGFVMEAFLRPDTGASGRNDASGTAKADPFWSRASNVYLQGGFGKLVLGRQIDPVYAQMVAYNPFGGAFGLSPAIRLSFNNKWGNDKGDSGWSNAVSYATPNMGGLTLSTAAQAAEVTDGSEGSSYSLAANYVSGPLAVGGVWQTVRSVEAPKLDLAKGQRQTFGLANLSYDAGFAKFFAEYGKMGNHGFTGGTRINTMMYQLGASVPVTATGKVLASFGQSKEKPVEGGTTPKTLHNILTLAYDHFLSKRTDTYVAVMMDNEKLNGYKKGYSYVAGLRHAF